MNTCKKVILSTLTAVIALSAATSALAEKTSYNRTLSVTAGIPKKTKEEKDSKFYFGLLKTVTGLGMIIYAKDDLLDSCSDGLMGNGRAIAGMFVMASAGAWMGYKGWKSLTKSSYPVMGGALATAMVGGYLIYPFLNLHKA